MAYKYKYFRKVIPEQYREQLGLREFKLSLKDIEPKYQTLVKAIFEVEFDNIFKRVSEFNHITLKEYMELIYYKTLLDLYNIKSGFNIVFFRLNNYFLL